MKENKAYVKIGLQCEQELFNLISSRSVDEEEAVNATILAFQCLAARLSSAYGKEGVEDMIRRAFEYIEIGQAEGIGKKKTNLELVKLSSTH